jgi:hypothetical protein
MSCASNVSRRTRAFRSDACGLVTDDVSWSKNQPLEQGSKHGAFSIPASRGTRPDGMSGGRH